MVEVSSPPAQSAGMQHLIEWFDRLQQPYDAGEILRFNLVFKLIYPDLDHAEKTQAERLLGELLAERQAELLS